MPVQKSIDDAQSVFDALDAFIAGTAWTTAAASVTFDGAGVTHSMNCNDRAGNPNSFTYTERTATARVTIAPVLATLGPGGTQQFTASATDADGAAIPDATFTWVVTGLGTVDPTGLYTAPATIAAVASDSLRASLDGAQAWASITIQLTV